MSQYLPNKDFPAIEMDCSNQAILVSADVERNQITHSVRASEFCAQFRKIVEAILVHDSGPPPEWGFTVGVQFPKFTQRFLADNVHV